jgi:transposase-like protein
MDLLKKCPNCGKHFSVEKKGKELVATEHHMEHIDLDLATRTSGLMHDNSIQHPPPNPISEEIPVETETFETSYECSHCHYKWTEKSVDVVEGTADSKGFRA